MYFLVQVGLARDPSSQREPKPPSVSSPPVSPTTATTTSTGGKEGSVPTELQRGRSTLQWEQIYGNLVYTVTSSLYKGTYLYSLGSNQAKTNYMHTLMINVCMQ